MFKSIQISLSLYLLFFTIHVTAQIGGTSAVDPASMIPSAPEAATIKKFIDVPVKKYTGVPRLDIPLGSIESGNISLPISLSYHSSGHKVSEVASWVGLGWKLNAGGSITRKVNGLADDLPSSGFLHYIKHSTYQSLHTALDNENELVARDMVQGCLENTPDEFYFDINGYSGKFAFNWNGEIEIASDADIKIEFTGGDGNSWIQSWIVTDPDGNKYYLDVHEITNTVNFNSDFMTNPCHPYEPFISAWKLSRIEDPFNPSINIDLTYEDYSYTKFNEVESRLFSYNFDLTGTCGNFYNGENQNSTSKTTINGQNLKSIISSTSKVLFHADDNRADDNGYGQVFSNDLKKLNEIIIEGRNGYLIKSFKFGFDNSRRLLLESVQEFGRNGKSFPPYAFNYFNKRLPVNLNSKSVDYWGYYNGANNQTLLPSYLHKYPYFGANDPQFYYFEGANRQTNLEYTKADVLQEIIYPTGSKVQLVFEQNQYSYIQNRVLPNRFTTRVTEESYNKIINGNRVKKDAKINTTVDNTVLTLSIHCETNTPHFDFLGSSVTIKDANNNVIFTEYLPLDTDPYDNAPRVIDTLVHFILPDSGTYHVESHTIETLDKLEVNCSHEIDIDSIPTTGGLRIKQIRYLDQNDLLIDEKSYEYKDTSGLLSSGVIFKEPLTVFRSNSIGISEYSVQDCQYIQLLGSDKAVLGATQGSHVGYRFVTEYVDKDKKYGKICSYFTSPYDYQDNIYSSKPFGNPVSHDYKRGLEIKTEYYRLDSVDHYTKVKTDSNTYQFHKVEIPYINLSFGKYAPPNINSTDPSQLLLVGSHYAVKDFVDEKYAFGPSKLVLGKARPHKQYSITHFDNGNVVEEKTSTYDQNLTHIKSSTSKTSKGTYDISHVIYAHELADDLINNQNNLGPEGLALLDLNTRHIIKPIQTLEMTKESDGNRYVNGGQYFEFKKFSSYTGLKTQYELNLPNRLDMNYIQLPEVAGNLILKQQEFDSTLTLDAYSSKGNLLEFHKSNDQISSILWDNTLNQPIASITNARLNEVAYANFDIPANLSHNWLLQNAVLDSLQPIYGKASLDLTNQNSSAQAFMSAGEYILSLYQKSGTIEVVTIENGNVNLVESLTSPGLERNTIQINLKQAGSIRITGNTTVDELRLHPVDSRMNTIGYNNSNAVIFAGDENNKISTYEYDELNQLSVVRNHQNDIIVLTRYQYSGNGTNSILTYTARESGIQDTSSIINGDYNVRSVTVDHFDAFGRIEQSIEVNAASDTKDIVQIHEYDGISNEVFQYLPFVAQSANGGKHSNAKILQQTHNGSYGFAEKVIEQSPLKRTLKTAKPGKDWSNGSGHERSFERRTNNQNEIRMFDYTGSSSSFYPPRSLFVEERKDENGNVQISYTDLNGTVIEHINENAITHNVYDEFGLKKYVIPPNAMNRMMSSQSFVCALQLDIFKYAYDQRKRLIRKVVPGQNEYKYYYDNLDRQVLSVDGNGQKQFTKYDILGRPIMRGVYHGQSIPSSSNGLYETYAQSNIGYTWNNSFPNSNISVESINYFDNYDFNRSGSIESEEQPHSGSFSAISNETLGLKTGSKTLILGTADTICSRSYFDKYGLTSQNLQQNITGQTDISNFLFDFNGNVIKSKINKRVDLNGQLISKQIVQRNEYDHKNRLLKTFLSIDGQSEVEVSSFQYNKNNFLQRKRLGISDSGAALQDIDYSYNIHGWLTHVNKIKSGNVPKLDDIHELPSIKGSK
ncbi:MAG: DUF6443 domain-containing protein [Flavobacteriales bacterium]|nr:DUF6443 domain-containing protein [Flavobacteriales bacterium]